MKIIGLLLVLQLTGCALPAPKASPEASVDVVGDALRADSDKNVAKLYIVMEDRSGSTNLIFTVDNVVAGEISEDDYLYLKFDEGEYKILSEVHNTIMSMDEKGEIDYVAKAGAVDIISCPMLHFMPESKYVRRTPEFDNCKVRPFDSGDVSKLKDMKLRLGDVSHFKLSEYELFKKVKMQNTVAGYREYLKRYPNAEFKKSAERAIKQLKKQ